MSLKSILFLFIPLLTSFLPGEKNGLSKSMERVEGQPVRIEMVTNYGRIVLLLYDETPLHRDNFLKLIENKTYDSLLFHRVIKDFMIQAGDIQSKNADSLSRLGSSDLPYQIPAEIVPTLYHKKGALGAARTNNPQRASSSTQFYIVQGKIQNDSLLTHNENRINQFLARHYAINDPANKPLLDSLELARTNKDSLEINRLDKRINDMVAGYSNFERYRIPEVHRQVYQSIGGSPHLDQNYTVFGEVLEGIEVVDAIAAVETNQQDRPLSQVRILSVRVLDEN
ncbi:peptidylprolyl isomerase [Algoriphagus lacus]|uniref:peptidylprolyl isomerase n=1 Tax=Algoriphagus lacus TaxID=2056311 RepID=A0A418PQ85_9BACT|nr:peptidylprolyl isomerase [Algoriphagus lacus]RIW14469.1 peptidylprolyl isomerase [Algoriphagus lacus]